MRSSLITATWIFFTSIVLSEHSGEYIVVNQLKSGLDAETYCNDVYDTNLATLKSDADVDNAVK